MIKGWREQPLPEVLDTQAEPTMVTKQFARDLPSLIRINGRVVPGASDNEKVVNAYNIITQATRCNEILTQKVMEVANQNLGIILYEDLVNHYSESGFLVKQTWYHYLDITFPPPVKHKRNNAAEDEVSIYMLAIFELQNSELDNNPPLFIKSMLEVTFSMDDNSVSSAFHAPPGFAPSSSSSTEASNSERMVHAIFSTPTFNILPFLHSIDLDDDSLLLSPPAPDHA